VGITAVISSTAAEQDRHSDSSDINDNNSKVQVGPREKEMRTRTAEGAAKRR